MPTWPQPSLSAGFTYVEDTQPDGPAEGETWYDLGGNEAKVYDGAQWHLLTVTDHSEVGGVQAGQHRSDANIQNVVDGAVDADTVDGQHAYELGGLSMKRRSVSNGSSTNVNATVVIGCRLNLGSSFDDGTVTAHYSDGSSDSISKSGVSDASRGPGFFAGQFSSGVDYVSLNTATDDQYGDGAHVSVVVLD